MLSNAHQRVHKYIQNNTHQSQQIQVRMKANVQCFSGVEWINISDVFVQWIVSRREKEIATIILHLG